MKYTVTFSCGHEGTVELFGKGGERQNKIKWYESTGLCPDCYKAKKREEDKKQGLLFNFSLLPYIDKNTGDILVYVWFSGDPLTFKDAIKSLNKYTWEYRREAQDMISLNAPKVWGNIISINDLKNALKEAESIGAVAASPIENFWESANKQMVVEKQAIWKEQQEEINAIPKPEKPGIISNHRWNEKVYGRSGNLSIYLDNEKIKIDEKTADILNQYLKDIETYRQTVDDIRRKYKI